MARLFSPRPPPSEDLFYETYYSLSQQYPLLLLLLVIVLCTLVALPAVAWASGRVRWARCGSLLGGRGRVLASGWDYLKDWDLPGLLVNNVFAGNRKRSIDPS